MLVKFLAIAVTRIPANVIHALILRWPKTRLYGAAISTEEIRTIRSTAAEILSRAEIESLLRALQAARNGAPEPLLSQAGTIASLVQTEVGRYPIFFAKLLHAELLRGPKTKPFAEVVTTEKLGAVLFAVVETLSDAEVEGLVRAALLHNEDPTYADLTVTRQ